MGLDVYLYRYEDFASTRALENALQQKEEEIWNGLGEYSKLTEEQKEGARAACKKAAAELGVDEDGNDGKKREIHINSALHPDHIFKVGYFRSSYNDGGIDRKLRAFANTSLAQIMGHDSEAYAFCPDWKAARERAQAALDTLRKLDAETQYEAVKIDPFSPFTPAPVIDDPAKAIAVASKVISEHGGKAHPFGNDFSSRDGIFLLDSKPQCIAFIPGVGFGGSPVVWGITEAKPGQVFGWYVKAMEIVVGTCDYVIGTGEPEKHYLHWSG